MQKSSGDHIAYDKPDDKESSKKDDQDNIKPEGKKGPQKKDSIREKLDRFDKLRIFEPKNN